MKHIQVLASYLGRNAAIQISPFSSVYKLKKEIEKSFNIKEDYVIIHDGTILSKQDVCLYDSGLKQNTWVMVRPRLKGGNTENYNYWFYLLYYVTIFLYLILLISGLIPFIANVFARIFDNTLLAIMQFFEMRQDDVASKALRAILNAVMWIITQLATLFFVWATASFIFYPWLYQRKNDFCNSGLAAKRMGFWTMVVYMVIYSGLNIFDFALNMAQMMVDVQYDPEIIKAFLGPSIQTTKEAWDISKFLPLYSIPFVGQMFLGYHLMVDGFFIVLYQALNEVQQFDCEKKSTPPSLCKLFSQLNEALQKKNNKKTKKDISSFLEKLSAGSYVELANNYKLKPLINLLQRGFCDLAMKAQGKDIPDLKGTAYEKGSFNRWSSNFATSVFCQFLEAISDVTTLFSEVGTEQQVANMVKTGNFAGSITVLVILILFLWTFFAKSFEGYKYG